MAKTVDCPTTWRVGPTSMNPSARRAAASASPEVVAVGHDAVAAEPDVGRDVGPGLGGHGERPQMTRARSAAACRSATAQDQLDPDLDQLASELGLELGRIRSAEDVVGGVEQDDRLVRPDVTDLAGQLDADRAGTDEEDPIGLAQCLMGLADLLLRVPASTRSVLAGKGYLDPVASTTIVGGDLLARRRHHPVRVDLDGPVPHDPAVGQQPRIREVDPREPGRIDQRPQGGDVVHEGVLGLDEDDIGRLVQAPSPRRCRRSRHRPPPRSASSSGHSAVMSPPELRVVVIVSLLSDVLNHMYNRPSNATDDLTGDPFRGLSARMLTSVD